MDLRWNTSSHEPTDWLPLLGGPVRQPIVPRFGRRSTGVEDTDKLAHSLKPEFGKPFWIVSERETQRHLDSPRTSQIALLRCLNLAEAAGTDVHGSWDIEICVVEEIRHRGLISQIDPFCDQKPFG